METITVFMKKVMETITVFMEKVMANNKYATMFGIVALVGPIFFIKTLYAVWFGSPEILVGFKSENATWFILSVVDLVAFFTTLPARKKGRVMQVLMGLWTIEMSLVFLATIIR